MKLRLEYEILDDKNCVGVLLDENNIVCNEWHSSNLEWLKNDLYQRDSSVKKLNEMFPEGWEIILPPPRNASGSRDGQEND